MGAKARHFKALSKKNWIVWKRNICGSICEIMCPLVLMALLAWTRMLVDKEWIEETSNLESATMWHPQFSTYEFDAEGEYYQFLNFTSEQLYSFLPESYCQRYPGRRGKTGASNEDDEPLIDRHLIGVAPDNEITRSIMA